MSNAPKGKPCAPAGPDRNLDSPIQFPFDRDAFFQRCAKSKTFPRNDFEKQAVLLGLIDLFNDGTIYSEQEVNLIINKYVEDHALLRRELVNFNYLGRDNTIGTYWVKKRTLTYADLQHNTLLRRHAKAYLAPKQTKQTIDP
jgi:hypothetical protein